MHDLENYLALFQLMLDFALRLFYTTYYMKNMSKMWLFVWFDWCNFVYIYIFLLPKLH